MEPQQNRVSNGEQTQLYLSGLTPGQPDLLATSASDHNIALYDLRMGKPTAKLIMATNTNSICWNPMEPFNFTAVSALIYVFESLIGTLLNIPRKTKDGVKTRLNIPGKTKWDRRNKLVYTQDDLDVLRNEWAKFIISKYL